jgi:hypothetical protein
MMQLETGVRRAGIDGRVVHVIELLDAAMRPPTHTRRNGAGP